MKKLTLILSSLLAGQVLLAILLLTFKADNGVFHSEQTLLGLTQDAFDAMTLEQKDKPALTLKKDKAGQWILPGYFNVPVANAKMDDFNRKLLALKTAWPVAHTEEAADRFQVTKDKFERKIVFQKEGQSVKMLFLGSTPSFKKIHARVDGQSDIQVIDFNAFDANAVPEDWMKQDLLKLDVAQLSYIKGSDFTLVKTDKDWSIEGLPSGQTSNTTEIKAFLDKLSALNYSGIAGIEEKPEYHLKEPALMLTIKQPAGEVVYQFGKQDGSEDYVLKVSTQPYYFKVNKGLVEGLKDTHLQKLVTAKSAEISAPASTQGTGKLETAPPNPPK